MFDFLIDLPESVRLEQLGFLADSDPELAVELSTMLDRYQQQSSVLDAQAAGAASLSGPAIHAASVRKVSTDQGLGVGRAISKRRRLKQSAETGSRRRRFAMANIIATLVLLVLATGAFSFVWSEVKEEMMFLADWMRRPRGHTESLGPHSNGQEKSSGPTICGLQRRPFP